MNPYSDDALVREATKFIVDKGSSIFQIFLLDEDEDRHIEKLLLELNPKHGSIIVDAGCGVGSIAEKMYLLRPDLRFSLLNISRSQLEMCPNMEKIEADFQNMPIDSDSVDVVMFNYSIGHGDIHKTLIEAARVLRQGGVIFLYDLASSVPDTLSEELNYNVHSVEFLRSISLDIGLSIDFIVTPSCVPNKHFLEIYGYQRFLHTFEQISPMMARLINK